MEQTKRSTFVTVKYKSVHWEYNTILNVIITKLTGQDNQHANRNDTVKIVISSHAARECRDKKGRDARQRQKRRDNYQRLTHQFVI